MKVKQSIKLDDIYDVNMRSADSHSGICIFELGSLSDLIGMVKAEEIRAQLLRNKVKTLQLTNHQSMKAWTKLDDFVKETMKIRFVPENIFAISREILIFDGVVAMYQKSPDIQYVEVVNIAYAKIMRQLFESLWMHSKPLQLGSGGSITAVR